MCRRTACRKREHLGGKRCQAAALLPKASVSSSVLSIFTLHWVRRRVVRRDARNTLQGKVLYVAECVKGK